MRAGPGRFRPTPIRISRRTRTVLVVLGLLLLVLIMWFSPTVPVVLLGGFAVALVLSFPVRWLSHIMPRWLAMLVTFLCLVVWP
jgi:predicted PurR-regulated permease PerM